MCLITSIRILRTEALRSEVYSVCVCATHTDEKKIKDIHLAV